MKLTCVTAVYNAIKSGNRENLMLYAAICGETWELRGCKVWYNSARQNEEMEFSIFPLPEWSRWFVAILYFLICHFTILFIKAHSWSKFFFFGNEKWLTNRIEGLLSFGKIK